MKKHNQKGITLIEVLLAIAISGLLLVVLFSVLNSILKNERRLGRFNRLNQSVTYIFSQITEDVRWSDDIIIENAGTRLITIYNDDSGTEVYRSVYELTADNLYLTRPDENTNIPTTYSLLSPEIEIQELEFSNVADTDHRPLIKTIISVKSPGTHREQIVLERNLTISNIQKNIEIKEIESLNPPTPTPTPEIIITPGAATPTPTTAPPASPEFPEVKPLGYGEVTFTPGKYLVRWHSAQHNKFEKFLRDNGANYTRLAEFPFLDTDWQSDGLMAFYEYDLSGFSSLEFNFNASGHEFGLWECINLCENIRPLRNRAVVGPREYTLGNISTDNIKSFNYQMIDSYNNTNGFAILKVRQPNGTEQVIKYLSPASSPNNDIINENIKIPNTMTSGQLILEVNGSFGIWFTISSTYVEPTPVQPPVYIPD